MEYFSKFDSRSNRLITDLCDEIDDLISQRDYWKERYEEEAKMNAAERREALETAKRGVANALMFALTVKDDVNGNLVITSDDRKWLAESIK